MRVAWAVEDNDPNYELVEFLLADAGWSVVRASDSVEFRRLLEGAPPDVILLDMNLPDTSGLDLLAELRATSGFADTPVIALTAHAMRGDQERFLEAGCDGYVSKPIDTTTFLDEIEATVSRKRS